MYCRNCGKQIEKGAICQDCLNLLEEAKQESLKAEASAVVEEPVTSVEEVKVPSPLPTYQSAFSYKKQEEVKKEERPVYISNKKGIASVILSPIALIFQSIVFGEIITALAMLGTFNDGLVPELSGWASAAIIFAVPAIIGLVFAILSFVSFFKNKKNGKKTWSNLILGIVGMYAAIGALIFTFYNMILALVADATYLLI